MVFFHDGITSLNGLKKLEVEFKVMGNKDRKTKWRIESSFEDPGSNSQPLPHAFYDDGSILRFRLIIDVDLIGDIGGTESPDNDPVQGGEFIEWKWKLDFGDRVQYDFDDNESGGVIVINEPTSANIFSHAALRRREQEDLNEKEIHASLRSRV